MEGSAPSTETECSMSLADITSPSQLQEVTLEHDGTFSNTMGVRSPSGPMRGRSVKEFEEQLTNLKKENFNLKLRIYFLEEKMGSSFTLDKDNIVKKYIELQVDYANLRKEMDEKQELLCQAVKAIELEDEEHKKYVVDKEDQLNMCQQEIEDLRVQLQDIKYDSEGASVKSDTTGFYSSKCSGILVCELQEKVKTLENELHTEKENSGSLQLIIGQVDTLKNRCDNMQRDIQAKNDIIQNLTRENESFKVRIHSYTEQTKDFQERLDGTLKENQILNKKFLNETRRFEELAAQYQELKKKYSSLKVDIERELKRAERTRSAGESRISDLEEENQKLKNKLRETQTKLETALTEIRKNQNLAVSTSLPLKSNRSHTDVPSISVQDPTTPTGTPKKDPLYVQVVSSSTTGGTIRSNSSTSISSSPSSPDKFSNINFENLLANATPDKILSFLTTFKNDYETQRQKLFKLKTEQFKACEIIKTMIDSRNKANDEIHQYQLQIKNLEKELESVVSKPTSDGELTVSLRERISKATNESISQKPIEECTSEEEAELYKALTVELENKIKILEATLKEQNAQFQKIRDQYEELVKSLEERDNKITELEYELISSNSVEQISFEKGDSVSEKRNSFFIKEIEEKDKEIHRLNTELKKCSCYLQEIVNTELWEKNKEIEKLHTRQVNSPEILKLRKDLTGKEQQLKVLKDKISELGLDLNISQEIDLKELTSQSKIQSIKNLQEELRAAKEERDYFMNKVLELEGTKETELVDSLKADLEKSEKLRQDANEACALLSSRLEELAVFLDSLLKQKSILGFLGIHKERKLREIINNSLDLSKSFNVSLVNPDQSLAQLSNLTSILNGSAFNLTDAFKDLSLAEAQDPDKTRDPDETREVLSIIPGSITLTYQSHLYKQNKKSELDNDEVIAALREQIVNLKSELQLRDNELNRLTATSKLSETDEEQRCRNLSGYAKELSKLYITPQKSNTTSTTLKYQSDCASESEGWSEPDRVVSRARIGLSQSLAEVSPTAKITRLSDSTDDDNLSVSFLYNKRQEAELRQEICDLKTELDGKKEELEAAEQKLINVVAKDQYDEVERKLLVAESKVTNLELLRKEAEDHITLLKESVDLLTKTKMELNEALAAKSEEVKHLFSLLEAEKTELQNMAARLEEVVQKSHSDQMIFENKEKDFKELENGLKKDLQELAAKLEEERYKFGKLEIETVEKIKHIEENNEQKIKEIQENYSDNHNRLIQELEALQEMVKSYQETIEAYKTKDVEYENKLREYQEKVNSLRKELDVNTLEYSESVVEKTRLANEKIALEQELKRYNVKDRELRQQMDEIHSDIGVVSQNYQQEIAKLQSQKTELQMKISVLESNNAELHNRFVRMQAPRQDLSASLPTMKIHSGTMYNRQFSHPSFSSEEHLEECSGYNVNASIARHRQPVDPERHEANASPDLGIESDQGRFSSLEIHTSNISRPLLQTIELTERMSNMLDDDNNPTANVNNCATKQCCKKTAEVTNENYELKRKLLRMRRALEETANQLNLANLRKKEVEKTICKQIHKTSQVLRKAKANLDSGSEC